MINYIKPVPNSSFKPIYKQIRRDFGLIGDIFTMHSPSPLLLAGIWAALRETELVGEVPRDVKEAIAITVSKVNQCPFCIDAHSVLLSAAGNNEVMKKIRDNQLDQIADSNMRSNIEWTLATRSPGSPTLMNHPFSKQLAPEIIGTVVINNYINRMMEVLLNQSAMPKNHLIRAIIFKAGAFYLSTTVRKDKKTGQSLQFLPKTPLPLPENLRWAESNPIISQAFASLADAANSAGESALDEEVRATVEGYLDTWDGKDPGISRKWVDQCIEKLEGTSKTVAKLALLTAIAPYQVDEELVQAFRLSHPEDIQLLHVLSWSSFTTSCKIGTWCMLP